jgi:hypothetical protein
MGILILIRWSISEMWLFVNLRAVSTVLKHVFPGTRSGKGCEDFFPVWWPHLAQNHIEDELSISIYWGPPVSGPQEFPVRQYPG